MCFPRSIHFPSVLAIKLRGFLRLVFKSYVNSLEELVCLGFFFGGSG